MPRRGSLFLVVSLLAGAAGIMPAGPPERLQFAKGASRLSVKGKIGGEDHDAYAIELRAGPAIRASVTAPKGTVNLSLCESEDYFEAEPVKFGRRSRDGRSWEGVIPATKTYYLYVTAYPEAEYTLVLQILPPSPHP